MFNFKYRMISTILLFLIVQLPVKGQDSLSQHLEVLRPFINKTWKAKVAETEDKSSVYDISKWERILNGNGVRILHSVNDGAYGGETIVMWDKNNENLFFYYFTTAGFYTKGDVTFEEGKMISHEIVSGNDEVSEVKSIAEIIEDGKMKVTTQFLKNGEWTEGRDAIYAETPEAEVIFK